MARIRSSVRIRFVYVSYLFNIRDRISRIRIVFHGKRRLTKGISLILIAIMS